MLDLNRITVVTTVVASALFAAGCTTEESEPASGLTYYADVQPIIEKNCVGCHQDGAIGQGLLTTYGNVASRAQLIKQQVVDRLMPPWLADGACNDYQHDRSLTEEEIAILSDWADAGAPEGTPVEHHTQPEKRSGEMSRVDLTLSVPVDYVPQIQPDDYRCFLVDWPESEVTHVTGFGVRPGNGTTVHHVIAFIAPPDQVQAYEDIDAAEEGPGYTCYGGPGGPQAQNGGFLGGWAPGGPPLDYPEGTGIKLEPGSKIILQVHYNTISWDGQPDRTSVDLKLDKTVQTEAMWAFFTNPNWFYSHQMPIPAGAPDVEHSFAMEIAPFFGGPVTVYDVTLHMHTRGTKATLDVVNKDQSESCLLDIPRWDFNWQFPYRLAEPRVIDFGDQLRIDCHWDNSPENQPVVDGMQQPPTDINWGEGTHDEMCLGAVYATPAL